MLIFSILFILLLLLLLSSYCRMYVWSCSINLLGHHPTVSLLGLLFLWLTNTKDSKKIKCFARVCVCVFVRERVSKIRVLGTLLSFFPMAMVIRPYNNDDNRKWIQFIISVGCLVFVCVSA